MEKPKEEGKATKKEAKKKESKGKEELKKDAGKKEVKPKETDVPTMSEKKENGNKIKINSPKDYWPIANILKSFSNDITQKTVITSVPVSNLVSYEKMATYLDSQATTKEKAAFLIYEWITKNIAYDHELKKKKKGTTAEVAFKNKKSICAGYADLYCKMLTKIGIRCVIISGDSRQLTTRSDITEGDDNRHAWNAVNIHGEWYLVDCTCLLYTSPSPRDS